MAIQALSSVTNKGNSNISFEKRGEKPAKGSVSNVTSPLKAVPLAALIAMSPLTTTNAENIMRAENNANRIELAEAPQSTVLMYGDIFTSQDGTEVVVMAVNTKGGTDSFDKILLTADDIPFEAKDLVNREIYLYGENGVKEGPMYAKEVIATSELNGKITELSFLDPQVVNYVEAVISQPTNQSNIKGVRQAHNYMIVSNEEGDLVFLNEEYINKFLVMAKLFEDNVAGKATTHELEMKGYGRNHMGKEDIHIKGSHGNYTLKFYDLDNDLSNFEEIRVVHKDKGGWSTRVRGVSLIDGRIHGMDASLNTGRITAISLDMAPEKIYTYDVFEKENFIITDDILGAEIIKAVKSPEYNKNSESSVKVNQKVSNLVFVDKAM